LYVCRNVHLGFLKIFISDVLYCSVKYSELCLAGISQKSQPPSPPPLPPKKSIGARPDGFKNLYPSKKPATVTQQLQKSIDFRRIELYDFHLRPFPLFLAVLFFTLFLFFAMFKILLFLALLTLFLALLFFFTLLLYLTTAQICTSLLGTASS
jgi:hypothetical protein